MTDSTTSELTATRSADLLAAVADLEVLALGGDRATPGPADTDEPSAYPGLVERISGLAGELGYTGLQSASLLFQDYLEIGCAQDSGSDAQLRAALQSWPGLVKGYLTSPPGTGAADALIRHLQLPLWDPPLMPEDVEMLQGLLREERPQSIEAQETPSVEA